MSFLFIFVIFIILIIVIFLFVSRGKFKQFNISYTNRTFKRIDKDIINPINRMGSMCMLKSQDSHNQINISSPIRSLLIQAIKLNQVTIEELDEIIRNVSRYQKEFDEIGTSLLQEVDRQGLRKIFGMKLVEFVNSVIDDLESKVKVSTSIEIERIKKQIEEM